MREVINWFVNIEPLSKRLNTLETSSNHKHTSEQQLKTNKKLPESGLQSLLGELASLGRRAEFPTTHGGVLVANVCTFGVAGFWNPFVSNCVCFGNGRATRWRSTGRYHFCIHVLNNTSICVCITCNRFVACVPGGVFAVQCDCLVLFCAELHVAAQHGLRPMPPSLQTAPASCLATGI